MTSQDVKVKERSFYQKVTQFSVIYIINDRNESLNEKKCKHIVRMQ